MTNPPVSRSILRWSACAAITVGIVLAAASWFRPIAAPSSSPAPIETVVQLRVDGEIEPVLADYIVDGIHAAAEQHASLVLISINTPGGLDSSMRRIIQAILESPVPVVNYVSPTGSRAASAGFFILLSADVAAMSPGTDTGAASPILAIGGQPVQIDDTLHKKIVNEATAYLRSYVSQRGRNVDLAATAVSDAKAFSEKESLAGKLIDLVEPSTDTLLAALNGRAITRFDGKTVTLALDHPVVTQLDMTARQKFLSRIVQPDAFYILLILGVLGLYTEFTHPGVFAPGVIGGICIVLAGFAMHLLPVSATGLLLIALALGLFILEAKFPTHGILGVGGFVSMILGALLLIRSPITGSGVHLLTAVGVAVPFAIIAIVLMRLVLRSRSWKVSTGKEEMIGEIAEVVEPFANGETGMVRAHGELWRAALQGGSGNVLAGAHVRVKRVDGLTLEVEPACPGGLENS
jgi:membrane-bound serine protease (ClpP class)